MSDAAVDLDDVDNVVDVKPTIGEFIEDLVPSITQYTVALMFLVHSIAGVVCWLRFRRFKLGIFSLIGFVSFGTGIGIVYGTVLAPLIGLIFYFLDNGNDFFFLEPGVLQANYLGIAVAIILIYFGTLLPFQELL